jgi:uncharacterized alkaline shock family protein YloU
VTPAQQQERTAPDTPAPDATAPDMPGPGTSNSDATGLGTPGTAVPAAARGVTRIADRAVAHVAVQAAREALRTGPDADSVPRGGRTAPRAGVDVRGGSARVRISVHLGYPSDIGSQCGAVRRQVTARVGELTGMEVSDVAVRVDRLHSEHLDGEALRRVR